MCAITYLVECGNYLESHFSDLLARFFKDMSPFCNIRIFHIEGLWSHPCPIGGPRLDKAL